METLSTTKETKALDAKRFIAEEVNLSRLPFFASATKTLGRKVSIRYAYSKVINGLKVQAYWEVSANAKYGYPGPKAEAVHTAIMQIVTEQGLPIRNPVVITHYSICKRLGIKYNTRNRRDIRDALGSIKGALIETEHMFTDKQGNVVELGDTPSRLYERVAYIGQTNSKTGKRYEYSAVWLGDFFLESINKGYVRPIDFEYYKVIRKASHAAPKIYKNLSWRFSGCFRHNNRYVKVDYDDLAIFVDVKRQPNLSLAKQKLAKAHNILLTTGFLDCEPEWQIEEQKKGSPPKFYILYYPGQRAREEYKHAYWLLTKQLELQLAADNETVGKSDLASELIRLGVSKGRAGRIAQQHTPKEINLQLDHLAHLGEIGRPITDNVGGWLADAVEKGYTPPKGFITRAEREARHKAHTEAEAQQREREEEDRKHQAEHQARYQDLDSKLVALPEADQQRIRQEIEMRIRQGFDDFLRSLYVTKPFDPTSAIHRKEYYQHLADLLSHKTP